MHQRKVVLAGVFAIGILAVGALLTLQWLTAESVERPSDIGPPPPTSAPSPAGGGDRSQDHAPEPAGAPAPLPSPDPPPAAATTPPPPPPGPRRRDLQTSLGQARQRILECAGLGPPDEAPGAPRPRPSLADEAARVKTVLLLELEPREGGMAVLGLREGVRGGPHHDDLVRCATEELSGQVLEASSAKAGKPLTMQFVVDPPQR